MIALRVPICCRLAFRTLLACALAAALCAPALMLSSCAMPSPNIAEPAPEGAPLWNGSSMPVAVVHHMSEAPSRTISFDTTEGTFMSIDVSADGKTLIFDLLGDIYQLPIEGGEAIALTTGPAWDQAPRFSPDGEEVYFVSDRAAYKNIWRLTLDDRSLHQVTDSNSDIMGTPNWSQDGGQLLAGVSDIDTGRAEIILHSIDPRNGKTTPIDAPSGPWIDLNIPKLLRTPITVFSAVQSKDGEVFFDQPHIDFELGGISTRTYQFDLNTRVRTTFTPVDALYSEYKPQLSHNGNLLAYFRQYSDRRTELRIRNRITGLDKVVIELSNVDDAYYAAGHDLRPNYAFTPDDQSVIFWHGGKIHRVNVVDGSRKIVPFQVSVNRVVATRVQPTIQHLNDSDEAKIIRWPSLSRDGRTMAFAAIGYVWVMNLETGVVRRLTRSADFEYMPAISPDGISVAYISFTPSGDDYGPGRLMIAELDGGAPQELLAEPSATFLIPKWSHDGNRIAAIREVDMDGTDEAAVGWTQVVVGEFHEVASVPATSVYMTGHTYARFVGFDASGNNLLFSYPRSANEIVLVASGLNGDASRVLSVGDADVGGIVPAPGLKHLGLTRQDGSVWLTPFDAGVSQGKASTASIDARLVSDGGGYYVDWYRSDQLTYGFGQNVHRYRLVENKLDSLHVKLSFGSPGSNRPIAFTGARLITMSGNATSVIESGTLVLIGKRIAAIGAANEVTIPSDAMVINVAGKTIMPGLLDTHYHGIGGNSRSAYALPNPSFSERSAVTYGITTAWEPGGKPDDGVPATADLQAAGRILGPRWSYKAAGRLGYPWETLTSYGAAFSAVELRRDLGAVVLKEYNTPTRRQRQWLSAAAREQGLGIVSHIDCFDCMMTRIIDGYTGGDHPYIPVPFHKDVYELLKQTGYIWTPNIVTAGGSIGGHEDTKGYFCRAVFDRDYRTDSPIDRNSESCTSDQDAAAVTYDHHRVSRVAEQVASAASGGVRIGVSAHNRPGSNLHQEMWYLWKGGIPIADVLRATTMVNAEKLGLQEEIGSLEVGKMADFLVLDENPLDDILNTLSLKYTVQGGVVYDSATAERVDVSTIAEAANNADAPPAKTGTDD